MALFDPAHLYPASNAGRHPNLVAGGLVWGLLALLLALALVELFFLRGAPPARRDVLAILCVACAAAALIFAVSRVRGRTRIADAFFPLVLLSPLLYRHHGRDAETLGTTLLATAELGLMSAAIIAMKRNNLFRYLVVAGFALALTALSDNFLMLLPAMVAWFIYIGYSLARAAAPKERRRGIIIMALGEILLLFFALACLLEAPAPAPHPGTLFTTIITFADFPLLVVTIILLALGWRTPAPGARTPPYFLGMLALLVGLLTLLLNNFQLGKLPPPGADQTVLELCLLYTVFALHGPRRLQWLIPPALMLAAAGYTYMLWAFPT